MTPAAPAPFVGIDVAKDSLGVHVRPAGLAFRVANDEACVGVAHTGAPRWPRLRRDGPPTTYPTLLQDTSEVCCGANVVSVRATALLPGQVAAMRLAERTRQRVNLVVRQVVRPDERRQFRHEVVQPGRLVRQVGLLPLRLDDSGHDAGQLALALPPQRAYRGMSRCLAASRASNC